MRAAGKAPRILFSEERFLIDSITQGCYILFVGTCLSRSERSLKV